MAEESVFSTDIAFKNEIRRRDNIIRNLGVEQDNLRKEIDFRKKELLDINSKIEEANVELKSINNNIKSTYAKIDDYKSSATASLEVREKKLNDIDSSQRQRAKDLNDQQLAINNKKDLLDGIKESFIKVINDLKSEINNVVDDHVKEIE